MGACYSKTGRGTDMSSNDHLPYEKVTSNNHQQNGHAKKDGYESVQTSEDYENRTPQTSIGVDANKNVNPSSKDLIQDNSGVPEDAETCKMDYMDAVPIENTVTQSDSGIVVEPIPCSPDDAIGLKYEQNTGCVKYQHNSDWYNGKDSTKQQEPLNERLETGRVLNLPLNLHMQSSTSDYVQTCSTFTPTPDSDLDDVHGEFPRLLKHNPNRKSETFILKSSLKKGNNKGRKNHRLSWKSADSLDIAASMMTCMDRTKSEASDLFGDELSINAPLATFDSVDFAIGSSYDFSQKLRNCYVEYYSSDTFEFKFDFSGLEGGSRTAKSDSSGKDSRGETTANIDKIRQAIHRSTLPSPAEYSDCVRCFYCGVGLRHWMSEDDPWIEHARWSTSCTYVYKMKGEEFVSLVKMAVEIAEREEAARENGVRNQTPERNTKAALADTANEDSHCNIDTNSTALRDSTSNMRVIGGDAGGATASTPYPSNADIQKYLLTDAAQSVLDMGYQPKLVQRAIERALKQGTEELTGLIIMEAVLEIEEEDKAKQRPQPSSQSVQANRTDVKEILHQNVLKRCLPDLVKNLDFKTVSLYIQQKEIFDDVIMCDILEQKTTNDKVRELIKQIQHRGQETYETFKECLVQAKQAFLKDLLEEDEATVSNEIKEKLEAEDTANDKDAANRKEGRKQDGVAGEIEGASDKQIDAEKIKREHRELCEATRCKICLVNTISVVFLPCGHLVTCPDCAPAMRKCPICRALIKGTVKTFFG